MNLGPLRCLRGPNVWATCPVLEATLDLNDEASLSSEQIQQTIDRLKGELPDTKGGTAEEDTPLSRLAQLFSLAALKLQEIAGNPVSFAAVRPTSRPGLFLAAIEFAEEPVGQAA